LDLVLLVRKEHREPIAKSKVRAKIPKFILKSSVFSRWHGGCVAGVMRRCWFIVVLVVIALVQVRAASTTLAEFPFQLREGFLWIKVKTSESEKPLNFLVDTGAGVSAINLNTAKRIGLKLGREVTVHGVDATLTGYWQQHLSAKAGEVRLPNEYLAVDLEKLSHSCEQPVDGLLGADFFRGRVVQIDFDAQRIRLLKRSPSGGSTDNSLPLQFRTCGMRVPIAVNDRAGQWVRLDTGCATPLQWVNSNVKPEDCSGRRMAIGLTEISIPQTKTAVSLGKYKFSDVPTGLHQTAIFPGEAGLVGNGLLSRFSSITIDGKAERLVLGKRRR